MRLDSPITIEFPGERITSIIREITNDDTIVIEIANMPMVKEHGYKQGEFIQCVFEPGIMGSRWVAKHRMALIQPEEPKKEEKKHARVRKSYK